MNKKSILVGAIALGAFTMASAKTFTSLGDGNDIRNNLSKGSDVLVKASSDLTCGDKKAKEGKCGEGKCGDKKVGKTKEGKCGEGKCGEGKCGGKKTKKTTKKTKTTKTSTK